MKHNLSISVSKEPKGGGIVACRRISIRERLLRKILGPQLRMVVLVPGDSVDTVSITEVPDGGEKDE